MTTLRSAVLVLLVAAPLAAAPPDSYTMDEILVLPRVGSFGRRPFYQDPILAELAAGTFTTPREGDAVTAVDGESKAWRVAEGDDAGWVRDQALRGGYALWTVESPEPRIMVLEPTGHSAAYAEGLPRGGDPYGMGWSTLPVRLESGSNDFLFHVTRGRLRGRLTTPERPVFLSLRDTTLPDLIRGEPWAVRGAVIVVNASEERLDDLVLRAGGRGLPMHETVLPAIEPLTVRKVGFWFGGPVAPGVKRIPVALTLTRTHDGVIDVLHDAELGVRVRDASNRQRRTFESAIDGSIQYYAITPRDVSSTTGDDDPPALYLTLHGASVEAARQAQVYKPKPDGDVVAPTNRRPFGFDWEDWGRLDALEVLDIARRRHGGVDPDRIYLTGHSMGGHGTWHLGVTFPGMFASIGPSAGWRSFRAYTGAAEHDEADPVEQLLGRATSPSDTVALSRNLLHSGVYILHGDKDDNVPVDQARFMYEHLSTFHDDVVYHEEPGAGHWWGDRCCDWPPMFEFFAARRRPALADVDHVEFHTANPGISSTTRWMAIEQQIEWCSHSSVTADRADGRVEIDTVNVERLRLARAGFDPAQSLLVQIDDVRLGSVAWPDGDGDISFFRSTDGVWTTATEPLDLGAKGPHRAGPFKDAFRHRVQLVYGTGGTPEENRWARAKARFDAETFWYRGNGSMDVVADTAFDPAAEPDRGVVLYGNRTTNSAWTALLGESPVQVDRGVVTIDGVDDRGDDLACLVVRPRPGSDIASVAAVAGTGPGGMRLTDRMPYFVSGVAYPDVLVFDSRVLAEGNEGVRALGFFGSDWTTVRGQITRPDNER